MSARIDEGEKLVGELRMSEAIQYFETLLQDPAEQVEAHLWLGKLRIASSELDLAQAHLDAVLRGHPENAEALALKGVIFRREDDTEKALRFLEKAKTLEPTLLVVHLNLSAAYRESGDLDAALRSAQEAVALYPANAQASIELARTYWQLGEKEQALQSAVSVLDIDSTFLPVYLDLAGWLRLEGQVDAAIVVLEQGLAVMPQSSDLHAQLSRAYLQAGKTAQGIEEARFVVAQRGWEQDKAHLAACLAAATTASSTIEGF